MTTMSKEITGQILLETVRQGMDHSVNSLDWQTRSRLTRLRLQALEGQSSLSRKVDVLSFSQGFAVALAITLAVLFSVAPDINGSGSESFLSELDAEAGAMDVLMSTEDMEFLENLEMYEWLEAEYG